MPSTSCARARAGPAAWRQRPRCGPRGRGARHRPAPCAARRGRRARSWAQRPALAAAGRQQLLVQVLDVERTQRLHRDRADLGLHVLDGLAVAVPARRTQPRPDHLEPLVEVVADGRCRPLDELARVHRRHQLAQRRLGRLAGAVTALRLLPPAAGDGVGAHVEDDRPRRAALAHRTPRHAHEGHATRHSIVSIS